MIKQFFKDTPNSVFFWNGLALLAFIILCCMGEDIALGTILLISIPALFMITNNQSDLKYDDNVKVIGYHWWAYLSPVTWAIGVIAFVLFLIVWIVVKGSEYAGQFNNWLNKK
jgi:hypothetical protein